MSKYFFVNGKFYNISLLRRGRCYILLWDRSSPTSSTATPLFSGLCSCCSSSMFGVQLEPVGRLEWWVWGGLQDEKVPDLSWLLRYSSSHPPVSYCQCWWSRCGGLDQMFVLFLVSSQSIANWSPGVLLLHESVSPNLLAHEHSYENGQACSVTTLTLLLLLTIKTNKKPWCWSDLLFSTIYWLLS